jgi:hypothetical protein
MVVGITDDITQKYQELLPGSAAVCSRVHIAISKQPAAQRFLLFDTYNLKSEQIAPNACCFIHG